MKLLPRLLKFIYYFTIVAAFCANMIVVSHTTALSVLGAGLALRGPDGSMMTATDGLYEERKSVFFVFGVGMACTVVSVVICVWILLSWEAALVCFMLTLYTCRTIWINYQRVQSRFSYDESETVDFSDIMDGPAAIQAVPMKNRKKNSYSRHMMNGGGMQQKDYKKSSSLPTDMIPLVDIDPYSGRSDMEWQSSSHQYDSSTTKRRGRGLSRSNSPSSSSDRTGGGGGGSYIQTI